MSQLPMFGSSNMNNYPWNHLITKIPPSVATKLNIGGCSYVLLGLLSIGLDVGAIVNGMISFGGFINGFLLLIIGILILYLSRHEVYVLTSIFILVFFELFFNIINAIGFIIIFSTLTSCDDSSSFQCFYGTWSTILIVDLVTCFVTLCLTIFNMITITSGRRPQYASAVTPTILYAPQMQPANVLYANPSAVIVQ
ncbi:unnamed protein product [Rotaria socialis]|uniref:Uncharacterized protein n=1 Tax=Rotaria socialis TaxID=392032 RepID=A0A818NJ35_9BILA|nr:unnamed protein product [Rotaria socialis]CAF3330419.1 unnamed protein product [Rotaria socialis]CAF3605583.1 unnamed protein product [Rotaria socialis]CAF3667673.1 unnamed protein product [Rotaria socialis]CAF3759294.1 unnamed protein product [Rotaria socialis]